MIPMRNLRAIRNSVGCCTASDRKHNTQQRDASRLSHRPPHTKTWMPIATSSPYAKCSGQSAGGESLRLILSMDVDNIPLAAFTTPPLTTVAQRIAEQA